MAEEELAAQLGRLVDRLRSMALDRLDAPFYPEPTRVAAAGLLAQRLADAAAGCEDPAGPVWRTVPTVSAAGAGDLVAVCGHDLLAAAALVGPEQLLPQPEGGVTNRDELLAGAAKAVLELRRRL
ncbi:MAG TPA: hypothetical protein VFN19_00830 [Candidatus Nanopelagicales bacterium]|nr:hypothetical protein [Candidatus Nanopelagicales bacterium]